MKRPSGPRKERKKQKQRREFDFRRKTLIANPVASIFGKLGPRVRNCIFALGKER